MEVVSCPGCGGRNEPDARECEWCGRPFVAQPRRLRFTLIALGGLGAAALVLLVAGILALVSLVGVLFSPATFVPSSAAPIEPGVAPFEQTRGTSEPTSEPSQQPAEFVRIANTGGTGAFIREEPRSAARGIVAYPERTVLRIIGSDTATDGTVWRNVEDQRGVRGWTPAQYLVPSDVGF